MATLLVTYDLHDASYEKDVLDYIRRSSWAKASNSSYMIITNEYPSTIIDNLRALTKDQITVYVFSVRKPYAGYGHQQVNEFLSLNMPD